MIGATRIIHGLCGAPAVEDASELAAGSVCWLCGCEAERGVDANVWASRTTFTNQNRIKAPWSEHVCEPCVHTCAWNPPPDRKAKDGQKKGPNFQNFSHLWCECHGYRSASKGEKPAILAHLRAPHAGRWFAAIADSGQKHTLPWTPINSAGARGRVMFEEVAVTMPASLGLVTEIADLLTAGSTKEEIGRGAYSVWSYDRCAAEVEAFEARWSGERASPWWSLALWLAQRDEETVAARMAAEKERKRAATKRQGQPGGAHRRSAGRDSERVPAHAERLDPQALGSDPGPDADGGAVERERGGVGHVDGAGAEAERAQLQLFGKP